MAEHDTYTGLGDDDHPQYLPVNGGRPVTGGLRIDTTTGTLRVPRLTTTERNALTPQNGDLIYNTTMNRHQRYQNGGWQDGSLAAGSAVVTIGHPAGLTEERELAGSTSLSVTDNGANSSVVLAVEAVDGGFY